MRHLISLCLLLALAGCMKVSDMAEATRYQLGDAGLLDHSATYRSANWRLQPDSYLYFAQSHMVPPGSAYPRPNVVAEEALKAFAEYFPQVRRATQPLGFAEAMSESRALGAHYLLYARFAQADDRIGSVVEWEDQEALDRLGVDNGVIQMMLVETATGYLVDSVRIRMRGGLLTLQDKQPQDLLGPPLTSYARSLIGLGER